MMNVKNQNDNIIKIFYISLLVTCFAYFVLFFSGDFRPNIINYFYILVPVYLAYFFIVFYSLKFKSPFGKEFIFLLIVAILIRIILIPANPILSDDVYRYLWDGNVFYHGFNPFAFPPNSPTLAGLRDNVIFPNINFPGIPTVYPPLSQIIFAIAYFLGYKVIIWKLMLFVFESILVFFLYKLIQHFQMSPLRLSIYLLNPLIVIETYSSGHLEVISICFFIIGLYYFYKNKNSVSVAMFIFSILAKYNPVVMILPLLKKRFLKKLSVIAGVSTLALIPFTLGGVIPTAGFISYTNRWEFNGFLHKLFLMVFDFMGGKPQDWFTFTYNEHTEAFYITGSLYFKIIALIILISIIIDQFNKLKMTESFRGVNYLKPVLFVEMAVLLLSPTLYPWYLLWVIPLLIFLPNWSWLFFTMLIQLSYFVLQDYTTKGVWEESTLILLLQYLPFYGLLIVEYLDKRKIKGWGL